MKTNQTSQQQDSAESFRTWVRHHKNCFVGTLLQTAEVATKSPVIFNEKGALRTVLTHIFSPFLNVGIHSSRNVDKDAVAKAKMLYRNSIKENYRIVNHRSLWSFVKMIMNDSFLCAGTAAFPHLFPELSPRLNDLHFHPRCQLVFCQSVCLNIQQHHDMLPGAKVRELEAHYKPTLWASFSQRVWRKNMLMWKYVNANL